MSILGNSGFSSYIYIYIYIDIISDLLAVRRLDEELKKKMNTHQENQLSLIEKQRRSWEITREKAEQMSQIFDSLIITSNKGNG